MTFSGFQFWRASPDAEVRSSGDSLRVRSARRAEKVVDGTSGFVHAPRDPKDVILVIEFTGISVADFENTPIREVFVSAGNARFEPKALGSGTRQKTDASGPAVGPWRSIASWPLSSLATRSGLLLAFRHVRAGRVQSRRSDCCHAHASVIEVGAPWRIAMRKGRQ